MSVTDDELEKKQHIDKHTHEHEHTHGHGDEEECDCKVMIIRLIIGGIIFACGLLAEWVIKAPTPVQLVIMVAAYLILGYDVLWHALKNILKGHIFDEHFLMSLSTVGAFAIGEYPEAVAVMLFYQLGEFFQDLSVDKSRESIEALMDIRPDTASVVRNGKLCVVSPDDIEIGETIVVKPGERIPLDGVILEGEAMLDTSALTGESVPRSVGFGDDVLSGCINTSGALNIRVTKGFEESTVSKIINLVENAAEKKAPAENFISVFARYYTPVVVILAAFLAVIPPLAFNGEWKDWLSRALTFLVISCPCALVISIPLAFFGGLGAASRHGVLVKGGNYLEALTDVGTVVFDKTGTLTKGVFKVTEIIPANEFTKEQVLEYAACAESYSNHPIAKSVMTAFEQNRRNNGEECSEHAKTELKKADSKLQCKNYHEIAGQGILANAGGHVILSGNSTLLETHDVTFVSCEKAGTKVYIAVDGKFAGCIIISDEIKEDSKKTVAELKRTGMERTVMLTGDEESIGKAVADEIGIDEYYAGLLPAQKVEKLEMLDAKKRPGTKLAFVGDGINDAPVLARADVGIAMGGLGSDAAIEAADVVLMTDEPSKLIDAINIARETKKIVIQNIVFALLVKIVFLVLGALGMSNMWIAVFGDVGVALIAVFNSMRIISK